MPAAQPVPIRRLTLYKHGVAFVEREGPFQGEELRLVFRADELNDALKSLLALDRAGGRVLGIAYDTPLERSQRLADSPLTLSEDHTLLDLLRRLRGRQVRLAYGEGSRQEELTGRLLGVDVAPERATLAEARLSILQEGGAVTTLPLAELRRVAPTEPQVERDLAFFLDSSRAEETHRDVTIRLSPGQHDLAVSYVLPSPTWRVSYRLVAEPAAGDQAAEGRLLLQGWGLFDNRLEEDLDGVAATLVAGQPISFVYDLAGSHIPQRPTVADAARIAPGPVEFEEAVAGASLREDTAPLFAMAAAAPMELAPGAVAGRRVAHALRAQMAQPPAETREQGELFAYTVAAPVTVRRGASALVPILHAELPYRRLLLFNERKLPAHPVATLQFANGTGLVLERGPATVLEGDAYHGEAVVPFSREGAEVLLAYAVELGIAVTTHAEHTTETAGIRIAEGLLHRQQATTTRTTYRLENRLTTAQAVTIEHPLSPHRELVETPPPEAHTAEHDRWTVACPPRQATTFTVAEREHHWESQQVLDQPYQQLAEYLRRRWLDAATLARLRRLLDEHAAIASNEEEAEDLQEERRAIDQREEQVRRNMAALGTGGEEGALRANLVRQLRDCEARVAAIGQRLAQLSADSAARQAAVQQELATIAVDARPS